MNEFKGKDLNLIADSLKQRAYQLQLLTLDFGDLGSEIGEIIGSLYKDFNEENMRDFVMGFEHGISLTNGTH